MEGRVEEPGEAAVVAEVLVDAMEGGLERGERFRAPLPRGEEEQAALGGEERGIGHKFVVGLMSLAMLVGLMWGLGAFREGAALQDVDDPEFGGPEQIGEAMLTDWLLPFEVAGFLLLVAVVGAMVLARSESHEAETAEAEGEA